MGSQINITRNQFKKSYKDHYALYLYGDNAVSPKSRRLMLFYAVECGLKSLILKKIGKDTYEDLKVYMSNKSMPMRGHDINAMLKEVQLERYSLKRIQLADKGGAVCADRFNELWRYGAAVFDSEEEIKAEQTLQKIADWIGKRM